VELTVIHLSSVKRWLRKRGYLVSRYDFRYDPIAVRDGFCESRRVNVIFDVGANTGQFALQLRAGGYRGKIVSFEPLFAAFHQLTEAAAHDPDWAVLNYALGSQEASADINVANNSWSSSLLDMLPAHTKAAPGSAYIGRERIMIKTLDSVFSDYCKSDDRAFLKIDTQGFTKRVLEGSEKSLASVRGLQIEMSLVQLYEGEPLIDELVSFLRGRGFTLVYVFPEFFDERTGQELQVNGLFFRL